MMAVAVETVLIFTTPEMKSTCMHMPRNTMMRPTKFVLYISSVDALTMNPSAWSGICRTAQDE